MKSKTKLAVIVVACALLFVTANYFGLFSLQLVDAGVWNDCDDLGSVSQGRWLMSEGNRVSGDPLSSMTVDEQSYTTATGSVKMYAHAGVWGVWFTVDIWNYAPTGEQIEYDFSYAPVVTFDLKTDSLSSSTFVQFLMATKSDAGMEFFRYDDLKPSSTWGPVEVDLRLPHNGFPDLSRVLGFEWILDDSSGAISESFSVWVDNINAAEGPPIALQASIAPADSKVSLGNSKTFKAQVLGGTPPYTYSWLINGVDHGTGATAEFFATALGTYAVQLAVTDSVAATDLTMTYVTVKEVVIPETPVPTTPISITGSTMKNDYGELVLRGFGRLHDVDDPAGWWSADGESFLANREQSNMIVVRDRVIRNLEAMRSWGANMLRVHVNFEWWWQDVVNPSVDISAGHPDVDISYRDYLKTLVQESKNQGFYVIFCPYMVEMYSADQGTEPPIPSLISSEHQAVLSNIYAGDNLEAWRRWWISASSTLGVYNNVLFETWNEPLWDWYPNRQLTVQEWTEYSIEAYRTIRMATNNVVIFAFDGATAPDWDDELQDIPVFYDQLVSALGREPVNISFDFHAYRYTWNTQWSTDYDTLHSQVMSSTFVGAVRNRNLHVGCYEMGASTTLCDQTDEYNWFYNMLKVLNEERIPYGCYFWAPRLGLAPSLNLIDGDVNNWWTLGDSAPAPTIYGEAFIEMALAYGEFPEVYQSNMWWLVILALAVGVAWSYYSERRKKK